MSEKTVAGLPRQDVVPRRAPRTSVAFAVPDFDPSVGGTSRQVGLLARSLVFRAHEVSVFTRHRRGLRRAEEIDGIAVRRLGPPGYGRLADKLAAVELAGTLRRARPSTLITVQWTDAILAASQAGLLARTAVVWAARGDATDAVRSGSRVSAARRRRFAEARHVVLTDEIAAELRELRFPEPLIVPVAVDRDRFRPPLPEERAAARAAFSLDGEFAVLYVGHLRALKAVDALVDAFAAL